MEIAIYGAGSMGTVLGSFLCKAGIASDLISDDKKHIAVLKTAGAKIGGAVSFSTPPFDSTGGRGSALLPEEVSQKYDIIFLLTKQWDNAVTAQTLKNHLKPGGVICTMQNGLPEPGLAEILGEERVLGCVCIWGANKTSDGEADLVSKAGRVHFKLGCLTESHAMLGSVQEILEKIGHVKIERNFIGARWSKLLINAAFSGISTITGLSFGRIASGRISGRFALEVIRECIEVCRSAGITIERVQGKFPAEFMYFKSPLKRSILSFIMGIAMKNYGKIKSGMLHDLDRGRTCEIDSINGAVCKAGKKYHVPTPVNDKIVELVHSIERGERRYCPENLQELLLL